MEEDELLPGIGGETFQIVLGEEHIPNRDVLVQPIQLELDGITLTGRDEIGNEFLRDVTQQLDQNGRYVAGYDPYTQPEEGNGAIGVFTYRRLDDGRVVAENDGRATEIPRHNPFPTQEAQAQLEAQREGRVDRVGVERNGDQVGNYDEHGRPIDDYYRAENVQIINLGARRYGRTAEVNEEITAWHQAELRQQFPIEPEDAHPAPQTDLANNDGVYHRIRREGEARPITAQDIRDAMDHAFRPTAGLTAYGEIYARPEGHARNMRGLKNYTIEFLEQLRRVNEINGEAFEKIVEHLNNF